MYFGCSPLGDFLDEKKKKKTSDVLFNPEAAFVVVLAFKSEVAI